MSEDEVTDETVTEDEVIEVSVTEEEARAGVRLDRLLAQRELGFSRTVLQRWIDEGRVSVDGEPARKRDQPEAGAVIEIRPMPPERPTAEPQPIPLDVLFEDSHLILVNKPAGLVVHPAIGHPDGTLVNALLYHAQVERGEDPLRPGIVHRLDKDTSGVMVVAKSIAAREGLVEAFRTHDIERVYTAIVVGLPPPEQTFDTLHGRHRHHRIKFSSRVARGRRAVTHVRVVERFEQAALVECRLETGRTHQIRVHLSEAGHPILGDVLYGRPPRDPKLREISRELGRQALHAQVLGFVHPATGERLRFVVEPPADFVAALDQLRG